MGLVPAPRVYLYHGGAAVLSNVAEWGDGRAPRDSPAASQLLVVNTHQAGGEADVLTLQELRSLIDASAGSPELFDAMWESLVGQVAALVGTAVGPVAHYQRSLPAASGGFEILGIDVLLDQWMQPWVIEVCRGGGWVGGDPQSGVCVCVWWARAVGGWGGEPQSARLGRSSG
jgi:hypothetical protein